MATPTAIVAYLALFVLIGLLFLFVNLLVGRFVRPSNPGAEKLEIYECGEPAIGSSFVQFDLRFYVVALVFIVFDVEVAFLFPLATVFGKATNLMDPRADQAEVQSLYAEMGVPGMSAGAAAESANAKATGDGGIRQIAAAAFWAINIFFVVLLVGFAYEWKTGAFDWVRALTRSQRAPPPSEASPPVMAGEPSLSA